MSGSTGSGDDTLKAPRNEGPGGWVGPYKILQLIGEGGYGDVFEAEQVSPVRRRVALKVIKLGMDTRDVIARFEAERQALALMDHPHIARVLDAGATESGRPYFVMELVKGEPMAPYCDKHKLSILVRLKLFEQVCAAVQHAHTKGIIHRDLKPSNVLVSEQDDKPFAKVIDFGIAKATSGRLTDRTLLTEMHQILGTPLYMSPEQAEGSADIDTRTDIYSLGVMLYELLTGTTPVQSNSLRSAVVTEIQRTICEVEPPRPSVRLSQEEATTLSGVATQRAAEPHKLTRMVRGELDWIVMKALEKDRTRRYQTANGLAMDVRRYLAGEPVLAAPPSVSYRAQKFVRRHKGAVAAGSLIAAALMAGIAGFAWQARIAGARADELEQVSKFQAAMLGQVDPTEAGKLLSDDVRAKFEAALIKVNVPEGERTSEVAAFAEQWKRMNATDMATDLIDRTILKPAVAAIDKEFKDSPVVDAALRQVLADRYASMGLYDAAMPLQQRALATRRRVLGEEHPDTLLAVSNMGFLLEAEGRPNDAEPYSREAVEKRRRVLGEEHPDTLESMNNLGELLLDQGKYSEAEPYLVETLERRRRVLGEEHPDTLESIGNMGEFLTSQGKISEAEPYLREALEKRRRVLGEEHRYTLTSINNLGFLLSAQGKLSEAEPYYREALEKSRRYLGEEHPDTLQSSNNLGALLQDQGRLSEAEPYIREAVDKSRRVSGEGNPNTLIYISRMGSLLNAQGRHAEAERLLAPAEGAMRMSFAGDNAKRLAFFLMTLGNARTGLNEFAIAEANLLEAQPIAAQSDHKARSTRECTQAIIDLYAAWNAADPRKGYDEKAAEWKRKLDALVAADPVGS